MPIVVQSAQGKGGRGALENSERRGEWKHAILGVSQSGNRWNVVSD